MVISAWHMYPVEYYVTVNNNDVAYEKWLGCCFRIRLLNCNNYHYASIYKYIKKNGKSKQKMYYESEILYILQDEGKRAGGNTIC